MRTKRPKSDDLSPTPERRGHGDVEIVERPIQSETGEYGRPHIAVDLLQSLLNRNSINIDEKLAGDRFRAWFRLAQLDQLRAADFARDIVDGGAKAPELRFQAENARGQIAKAIRWLGGQGTSAASCVWHVLGLDESLRQWNSTHGRNISNPATTAVLIVALEHLAKMPWLGPYEKT